MKTNEQTKRDYLYAFEAEFTAMCKAAGISANRWSQGMWANAHMHHRQGTSVKEGVEKWFERVSTRHIIDK